MKSKDYEALFVIDPAKEESLKEVAETITGTIAKNNGRVGKEANWGRQRLSHAIKKSREGVYYKIDFSIDPSKIQTINSAYKLNASILRVMITAKEMGA